MAARTCLLGHPLVTIRDLQQLSSYAESIYRTGYFCNICGQDSRLVPANAFPSLHCQACCYDLCVSCSQLPEFCAAPRCTCGRLYELKYKTGDGSYTCHWNRCRLRTVINEWPVLCCPACTQNNFMCPKCSGIVQELDYLNKENAKMRAALKNYVPPVGLGGAVRIALFGQTGVGKSSFINTAAWSARNNEKREAVAWSAGSEGTLILEELLKDFNWHLVDTRGFFTYDALEDSEFVHIVEGRIQHGQLINRGTGDRILAASSSPLPLALRVHAVIFVESATEARLKNGIHASQLAGSKRYLQAHGCKPITVITHDDELQLSTDRLEAFKNASLCTGSSRDSTFFVANYTNKQFQRDPRTERQALLAIQAAIREAEAYISANISSAQPSTTLSSRCTNINYSICSHLSVIVDVSRNGQTFKYSCGVWYTVVDLLKCLSGRFPGAEGMKLLVQNGQVLSPSELVVPHGTKFVLE